jgi:hypothetical protein
MSRPMKLQTVKEMGGFVVRYSPDGESILNDPRVAEALERILNDRIVVMRVREVGGESIFNTFTLFPSDDVHEWLDKNHAGVWGNDPNSIITALRYMIGNEIGGSDMTEVARHIGQPIDVDNRADPEDILWHLPGKHGRPACGDEYPDALTAALPPLLDTTAEGDGVTCPACRYQIRQAPEEEVVKAVEQAKQEILADLGRGHVNSKGEIMTAEAITTFSDLHDYVDANEYGDLTGARSDWNLGDVNEIQDRVDAWLKAGGHRELAQPPHSVCVNCGQTLWWSGEGYYSQGTSRSRYQQDGPRQWVCPMGDDLTSGPEHHHQPTWLTLAEFRYATRQLPDSLPITATGAVAGDEWVNLHLHIVSDRPYDPEADGPSLILEATDDFDTRQW